jgi:acyl-[acyl carrier protein]--UDP-N-acetylglucosamine O-acyltransferase
MVHIGHGCKIGSGNIFSGGSHLCGHVTIYDDNFFGGRCSVRNRVVIGSNNMIGVGSNVVKNIGDNEVWAGNPAKKMRDNKFFG